MEGGRVVLYTRVGCHLCDVAGDELERFGLTYDAVDIDQDASLVEAYGDCVPVVEIDGRVRFRGRVNRVLLQRFLDAPGRSSDG